MDSHASAKVIAFSAAGRQRSTAEAESPDMALAWRRGLDYVEPALRAGPFPARPSPLAGASDAPATPLGAGKLSAMFIASLDDLICTRESTWPEDVVWPEQPNRQLEKVAVDIVDMLFGFILDNPRIPGKIKESLLAAQLPVLQMATREPVFFADWRHPARLLLNDVYPLYLTHCERGGEAERFAEVFADGMTRLLAQQIPSGNAFAALHADLRGFVGGSAERRTEAASWQRAESAAREFLERPLPQLARDFVAAHWIDVLQHIAARHDETSAQWKDALAVVEELAWSLTPKTDENERIQLIGLIPDLLTRLERGLDLIDLPRDDRRPFFDALIAVHSAMLQAETAPPPPRPAREESAGERVAGLQRGDWVEFRLDDGSRSRERLTWISPQRGILVFSNHQGQRAIQIAPADLIELVGQGRAVLIFDRAAEADRNSA